MQYHSFNDSWVKTISKDEFVEYGLANTDWTKLDLEAYYNEVCPTVKVEKTKGSKKETAPTLDEGAE
jgi:hypothetical protein